MNLSLNGESPRSGAYFVKVMKYKASETVKTHVLVFLEYLYI